MARPVASRMGAGLGLGRARGSRPSTPLSPVATSPQHQAS